MPRLWNNDAWRRVNVRLKNIGVIKMLDFKKPSEDTDFEDFFDRYDLRDFTDKMAEFIEK